MFRVPGFIDARIWAKVPHENRHFKIPIVYFSYIKKRLFVVTVKPGQAFPSLAN